MTGPVELVPLTGLPGIDAEADLPGQLRLSARDRGLELGRSDVLVVCQKVVSKWEGRVVDLEGVEPSEVACSLAEEGDKDPRVVEVVLRESRRIVRMSRGVLICETRHGLVCANAGVDTSNAPGPGTAILLPVDPDDSARRIRAALDGPGGAPAVVVTDSFGRPWREGQVDVAIGVAGLRSVRPLAGKEDWAGRPLRVSAPAVGDMLAAAAGLLMDKGAGIPAVVVRGYRFRPAKGLGGRSPPPPVQGPLPVTTPPGRPRPTRAPQSSNPNRTSAGGQPSRPGRWTDTVQGLKSARELQTSRG